MDLNPHPLYKTEQLVYCTALMQQWLSLTSFPIHACLLNILNKEAMSKFDPPPPKSAVYENSTLPTATVCYNHTAMGQPFHACLYVENVNRSGSSFVYEKTMTLELYVEQHNPR